MNDFLFVADLKKKREKQKKKQKNRKRNRQTAKEERIKTTKFRFWNKIIRSDGQQTKCVKWHLNEWKWILMNFVKLKTRADDKQDATKKKNTVHRLPVFTAHLSVCCQTSWTIHSKWTLIIYKSTCKRMCHESDLFWMLDGYKLPVKPVGFYRTNQINSNKIFGGFCSVCVCVTNRLGVVDCSFIDIEVDKYMRFGKYKRRHHLDIDLYWFSSA